MKKNLIYLGENVPSHVRRLFEESSGDMTIADGNEDPSASWDVILAIGDFQEPYPWTEHLDFRITNSKTGGPWATSLSAEIVRGLAIDKELPKGWEKIPSPEGVFGVSGTIAQVPHKGDQVWAVAVGVSDEDIPPAVVEGGRTRQTIPLHGGWFLVPSWVTEGK